MKYRKKLNCCLDMCLSPSTVSAFSETNYKLRWILIEVEAQSQRLVSNHIISVRT